MRTHIYWYEDTYSSNPSERGHIYSSKRTRILLYMCLVLKDLDVDLGVPIGVKEDYPIRLLEV
jgi:hypothetical protein